MQTPTYDNFQVAPNTLPQTRFGAQEMGDPGAAITQQAKVSMALGQHYGEQALQQMMAANQSVADQKWVEVENYRLQLQQEYEQERGLNALNREGGLSLADEYNNKLNQFIADQAESLNNRAQVEMFAQRVGPTQADFSDGVTKHMMAEGRKFQEETLKGRMDVTISGAIVAPTEQAFATAITRLEGNIGDIAAHEGWPPEKAQMELRNRVGEVVSQRANRLMDMNLYGEAKAMANQYAPMMDGKSALDLLTRIGKFQQDEEDAQLGRALAEAYQRGGMVDLGNQSTPPAGRAGGSGNVRTYTTQGGGSFRKMGGSRSWRNNNPGNIEYGDFARRYGAIGTDGRFAIFPDEATGQRARAALIFNGDKYRNLTLTQAIERYAPSSENHTTAYQRRVLAAVGGANLPMHKYSPAQQQAILRTMQDVEGWKVGRIEGTAGMAVSVQAGGGQAAPRQNRMVRIPGGDMAAIERQIDQLPPGRRESVRRSFRDRVSMIERGENDLIQKTNRNALDAIASGATVQDLPAEVKTILGPSRLQALDDYRDKLMRGEQNKMEEAAKPIYYDFLYHPEKLTGMSEEQIINLAPTIGMDKANNLLERKRRQEKDGDQSAPKVEAEVLNWASQQLNIKTGNNASAEDLQKRGWLMDNIMQANRDFYSIHKRYMTQGEMREFVTGRLMDSYVSEYMVDGVFWDSLEQERVPALIASPQQRGRMRYEQYGVPQVVPSHQLNRQPSEQERATIRRNEALIRASKL